MINRKDGLQNSKASFLIKYLIEILSQIGIIELRGEFMGLFDVFKKKTIDANAIQEKNTHRVVSVEKMITPKCSLCGDILTMSQKNKSLCVSCEWTENKFSNNKEVFHLLDKDGVVRKFIYSGYTRYSPNRSSRSGYGSDDWMYLCEENGRNYILMFSDGAGYGTGWICTELLEEDYAKMVNEDAAFWCSIAYSKERAQIYSIRLTDVESVRHLLPTCSRCGKLTDESYLR